MADDSFELTTLGTSGATSVVLSPDETRLYVAKSDGMIDVFNLALRTKIATWNIGTELGGISVSEDGSFLLAVEHSINPVPPYPPPQSSVLYRIDTTTGTFTTYTQPGAAYLDVEIVDGDTAIVTGGQLQVQRLDLTTGTFSDVADGVYNANSSTMVEDKHLTLLGEMGISNGPLALYDDRTDTIVARTDNYQGGATPASNLGHMAISEMSGLIAQFSYQAGINLYDLNLHFLRWMPISGSIDGLAFDPSGQYLFARLTAGPLVQYEVATGAVVESFALDPTDWHNNPGATDQITFSDDGKTILVHDNNTGKLQVIDLHVRDQQIAGTAGADVLAGGRGDDTYTVDHAGDTITELAHQGVDTARASVDFTLPVEVERLELTGGAIDGTGNQLNNDVIGNELANVLTGAGGNDWLAGGAGDDTLIGGTGHDSLVGMAGNDTLWGENGDDMLDGGLGNDTLKGGNGDDTAYVTGGTTSANTGSDYVDLGYAVEGGDEYGTDHLIIDYGAITQDIIFSGTTSSDNGVEFGPTGAQAKASVGGIDRLEFYGVGRLTVTTGSGNDRVYGVSTTDVISTGAGNDVIYGFYLTQGGPNRIDGGTGIDLAYSVNWQDLDQAVVLDLNDPGGVTVGSESNERYLRGMESLWGLSTGSGNDIIRLHADGALENKISTGYGSDTVTVYGGATHETTGFTDIDLGGWSDGDHVIADFGAAIEQVVYLGNNGGGGNTSIGGVQLHNYWNVEHVTVRTGSANDIVDGRDASWFTSHDFATGAGADLIYGGQESDHLDGGVGDDTISGGSGNDTVLGGGGGDALDGGAGIDTLDYTGSFAGVYVRLFNNTAFGGEAGGDTISSFENAMGSQFADDLMGSAGANVLSGALGNDKIQGMAGNDLVGGGRGNDILDGGDGIDTLDYTSSAAGVYVRLFNNSVFGGDANGDTITGFENVLGSSQGDDLMGSVDANVLSGALGNDALLGGKGGDTLNGGDGIDTLSYVGSSLAVYVRLFNNSVFGGDANGDTVAGFENVLGSSNNDDFIGSAGANVLDGALGNDKLQGLAGDDTLLGGKGGDTLDGGDGIDTLSYAGSSLAVYVRLFNNSVFGGDANGDTVAGFENVLGSSNNDDLIGSAGANVLDGALGNDKLQGLAGADVFRFSSALGAGNVDTVADYSVADDTVHLDHAVFAGLATGTLAAGAFATGAAASEADDRIIYNAATGALLFDADGSGVGAAVQFATLSAGLAMTAGEFVII